MRKISILLLLFMLCGCSINDNNPPIIEEPPVVDKEIDQLPDSNQKDEDEFTEKDPIENKPDENTNQKENQTGNEEETVLTCTAFSTGDECEPGYGKIDDDEEIIYIKEIKVLSETDDIIEAMGERNFNSSSKNNYLKWMSEVDVSEGIIREKIFINLQGEQIEKINEFIDQEFKYDEQFPRELSYRYSIHDNILSLLVRSYNVKKYVYYGGFYIRPYIFNIDLETNTYLTNEELMIKLNINKDEAQHLVNQQMNDLNLKKCEEDSEFNTCYFSIDMSNPTWGSSEIMNSSPIYIDQDGSIKMLIQIFNGEIYFDNDLTGLIYASINE